MKNIFHLHEIEIVDSPNDMAFKMKIQVPIYKKQNNTYTRYTCKSDSYTPIGDSGRVRRWGGLRNNGTPIAPPFLPPSPLRFGTRGGICVAWCFGLPRLVYRSAHGAFLLIPRQNINAVAPCLCRRLLSCAEVPRSGRRGLGKIPYALEIDEQTRGTQDVVRASLRALLLSTSSSRVFRKLVSSS